jgi:hypothetical protein
MQMQHSSVHRVHHSAAFHQIAVNKTDMEKANVTITPSRASLWVLLLCEQTGKSSC